MQTVGTAGVARWFGPIMVVWFLVLGGLGLFHIGDELRILYAFNPMYALRFLFSHGVISFIVLGAVFLAVTGAEALYADMGHFGRKPIQLAWIALVFPSLVLNYLGQGALILSDRKALENPFFLLAPDWALLPLVILATIATVIASQATITGAFSLARQAIQLGLLPRLDVQHTSDTQEGQIFIPRVNRILLIGVILLVLTFRTSIEPRLRLRHRRDRPRWWSTRCCCSSSCGSCGGGRCGARRFSCRCSCRSRSRSSPRTF